MIDMTVMRVTFSRCIGRNRRGKVKSKTGMEVPKAGGRLTPFILEETEREERNDMSPLLDPMAFRKLRKEPVSISQEVSRKMRYVQLIQMFPVVQMFPSIFLIKFRNLKFAHKLKLTRQCLAYLVHLQKTSTNV